MKVDYILDTNILIYLLAGKLKNSIPDNIGLSVITEIELLSFSGLTQSEQSKLKLLLNLVPSFSLTNEIKELTIQLRKNHKLKLPDSIICATALHHKAILLTNDKQLLNVSSIKSELLN